jgi:hypothetical protein
MSPKLKLILTTAAGTTTFWAILVLGLLYFGRLSKRPLAVGTFYFHPPTNGGMMVVSCGGVGDPGSVEWTPVNASFSLELVSSNAGDAKATKVYSRTSSPPEFFWLVTWPIEVRTNL